MKNKLLMLTIAITMSACGFSKKTLQGSGNGKSSLTAIDIGLPDRTQINVANVNTMLSAMHLQINDTSCTKTMVRSDILDYTNTARIDFALKQGCDYTVILALGQKGAGTQLAKSYYDNAANPQVVTAAQLQGKSRLDLTLYLQLTQNGQAAGLPAGGQQVTNIANNQVQGFVPTQPLISNLQLPGVATGQQQQQQQQQSGAPLDAKFNSIMVKTAAGASEPLAGHFKGTYLFADFSQLSCGPCISFSQQIESDSAVKSILDSGKCSMATFVSERDLAGWVRRIGGNAGAHSFGFAGGPTGAGQALGVQVSGTPTTAIIDRTGKVIKTGHQELLKSFKQVCAAN